MSKCPVCDTENAPGLTVCDFCGSELPETKKCKACGEEIPKNASYCPICKNLADVKPASSFGGGNGMPMYYVGLDDIGEDRQEVLKVVQELCKCGFEEAREIVDGDGIILNEVPKLEAEIAVSKLRGAGATAVMEEIDYDLDGELANNSGNTSSRTSSARSSSSSSAGEKSKMVAGLLALFGGGLGLHSFYLGYTMKGILHILLAFTGLSSIWALIEAVQIFTGSMPDADGNPLV